MRVKHLFKNQDLSRRGYFHLHWRHDSACRVIARLKKELDEAKTVLAHLERQAPMPTLTTASAISNGKRAAEDDEPGISASIIMMTPTWWCSTAFQIPPMVSLYNYDDTDEVETMEKAPREMANHERIETAGKKKEEGNLLFKNGKYQRAAKKYDKAVEYVGEEGQFGDDEQKFVKLLKVSCWLNGAACSLKLSDYQEAIKLCSKVLEIEFYNVKALYRRAKAYMETSDLQLAELDIMKALEADPHSREVKSIQMILKKLQAESNKRDAKLYSNMFARMAKDCSIGTKRPKLEKVDNMQEDGVMEMETEK